MLLRSALLVLVLVATYALLGAATDVFAHADYESSTPAKDEVVGEPPSQVDVFFTQEVSRQGEQSSVRVFNEADMQVSEGAGVIDDADRTHISAAIPSGLAPGRYIVRWTTLSDEDVESDEGAFCFYFGVEPTAAQQAECAEFDEEEAPTATAGGATATSPDAGPTPIPADSTDADDDGNSGAVVGAIVGAVIAAAVVGGALFLWVRRSRA